MMEIAEFETLLASHGADPVRWPGQKAEEARALLVASEEAQAALTEARELDQLLDVVPADRLPAELTARVLAALPVEGEGLYFRRSEIMAMGMSMAASLVVGISVGFSDLGRPSAFYAEEDLLNLSFGLDDGEFDYNIEAENEES